MDEKKVSKIEETKEIKNKNIDELKDIKQSNKNKKIIIFMILLFAVLLISVIFALININNEKILKNVRIMGIDVGDLSIKDAEERLDEIINKKFSEDIILKEGEYETSLNVTQINAEFDMEKAVKQAYNIGRDGNIFTNNYSILWTTLFGKEVECELKYNEKSLDKKIEDICAKLPGAVIENSYYIEDEELIIVKGKEGITIKKDELKNAIIQEIKDIQNKYKVIDIPTEKVEPGEIDIEKIRNEVYREPKDAYISKNPTTVHTHVNGVDFAISMEETEKLLKEDKKEYVIPLKITVPKVKIEDLGEEAFPDKLASFTTRYDPSNKNRANNIAISSEKIDGTVIMPGEVFSYNQVVGERTIAEGYKEASAYAGGKVVQDVGGGICQTSSTLYNAALLANLEIVDRSNHQFLTSYVSAGKDATVSWGGVDFQFKNNRTYPIMIEASGKNGVCTMSICGIKEETEYQVSIQSVIKSYIPYITQYEEDPTLDEGKEIVEQAGYTGCTSEAYKILKLNGEIVSKTLLSKDTYDPMPRIIRKGTKKVRTEKTDANIMGKNEEVNN